jgi:hypothetical protein
MVPTVHVKVDAVVAVRLIAVEDWLQTVSAVAVVITGFGFTVTVIVSDSAPQFPAMEVGVMMYLTEPAVELLGLLSTWLIRFPDPAVAPVIPPVIVPTVQV